MRDWLTETKGDRLDELRRQAQQQRREAQEQRRELRRRRKEARREQRRRSWALFWARAQDAAPDHPLLCLFALLIVVGALAFAVYWQWWVLG